MTAIQPTPLKTTWLLLAGYLGAVLLNLHHIALWCTPLALGASIWRARRAAAAPGRGKRIVRITVVLVLTIAVLVGFRTLNGIQAGASLLVAMAALKLTETTTRRDWLIVVSAALFLLLSACLDAQTLWRLPLYAAELCLLCMGMYALGAGAEVPGIAALVRRSVFSLTAAMPFAVLLFLLVPRFAGSFWALPRSHEAVTGLSDEMNPGAISELTESGEPAARVRFEGTAPPAAQRYWRAFVLHSFIGNTWKRGPEPIFSAPTLVRTGTSYRYEVSMEPSHAKVLLALELPTGVPVRSLSAQLTPDYELIPDEAVNRETIYRLESYAGQRRLQPLSDSERHVDLDLKVTNPNPRAVELAHTLRARADSDLEYIQTVLDYLRHGGFSYTLNPELSNSVDDLLFKTHEGFCGHYASAFALLMRAGGVPAHVVAGYLGGVWNRYGSYLLIRQSDAHAWTEVWLAGRGWVRVDPTAVVAPQRLTRGVDDLLPATSITQRMFRSDWIVGAVQAWQAINAWWQDEFIGFNYDRQRSMLERFGIRAPYLEALAVLLAVGASVWLAVIAWSLRPRVDRRRSDALTRSWRTLERKLKWAAAPRALYEGPVAYAERVGQSRPELAGTVSALAHRYARLRYGPKASAEELEQFRRAVRLLRTVPPRSPP
jgi:transglutaminase-like putative cysteine protease